MVKEIIINSFVHFKKWNSERNGCYRKAFRPQCREFITFLSLCLVRANNIQCLVFASGFQWCRYGPTSLRTCTGCRDQLKITSRTDNMSKNNTFKNSFYIKYVIWYDINCFSFVNLPTKCLNCKEEYKLLSGNLCWFIHINKIIRRSISNSEEWWKRCSELEAKKGSTPCHRRRKLLKTSSQFTMHSRSYWRHRRT